MISSVLCTSCKVDEAANLRSLLGLTALLLEALWPDTVILSEADIPSPDPRCLPLRALIGHVLRKSRATYGTLLVAFYYLALLRSSILKLDPTTKQALRSATARPLQYQRRMFLAALVLT